MVMKKMLTLAAAFAAVAGTAFAAGPFKTVKTDKGEVLAGDKGMTLYTFKNDKPGTSNCYDKCATNWPPALSASGANAEGAYTLVTRKDGAKQWAKDGMPLYYWVKDKKEGDTTGDGVNGVWDLARP
ncbi:COG4315 family predicted lipoprotein [Neorhizobium turbinariae]